MAKYFKITLRGGGTVTLATTEEVEVQLKAKEASLKSLGSCPCNAARRTQIKAEIQSLLAGAGVIKLPPELTPTTIQVHELSGVWEYQEPPY